MKKTWCEHVKWSDARYCWTTTYFLPLYVPDHLKACPICGTKRPDGKGK